MHMRFKLLVFMLYSSVIVIYYAPQQRAAADGCSNQTCDGIRVSYPFKLANATGCPSFSSSFELECDPHTGYLLFNKASVNESTDNSVSLRVLALTNDSLALNVTSIILAMKVSPNGTCGSGATSIVLPPFPSPYVFSDENKLGSFGCAYSVLVTASPVGNRISIPGSNASEFKDVVAGGCDMLCPGGDNNPDCGHNKCCVFHWPHGSFPRITVYAVLHSYFKSVTYDPQTCYSNYATLFHPGYTDFHSQTYGIKLMWALPSNHTTSLGVMHSPEYTCSDHSSISLVQAVPGYLCSCLPGYAGDGYALHGSKCSGVEDEAKVEANNMELQEGDQLNQECEEHEDMDQGGTDFSQSKQDIDECKEVEQNECIQGKTTCENTNGNYTCHCKSVFHVGDGRKSGSGCYFSPTIRNALAISTSILALIMALGSFLRLQVFWRKRLKRRYFEQNGGTQLQKLLIIGARGEESRKLFTVEELQAATKNYSSDMKLGVGGFGTVFKGVMADGRVVAIKKSNKGVNPTQLLNELEIMVQINHKNIVKFVGCCLETVEPLLVYEYVSNGNVLENLREDNFSVMNWGQRLKVAWQTAEALAYLHGSAVPPILHRDVKSSNVLLDNNFDAKVADFGVSRLVPEGATHISTAVQGTIGYLDPEYFQTLQLTEKSDVYSLGVMLAELITGMKPVDNHSREPRFANLALLFSHFMSENRLVDIIDPRLHVDLLHTRPSILAVAALALLCLSLHGSERPLMYRVAQELHCIMHEFVHSREPMHEPHRDAHHGTFGAVVVGESQLSVQTRRALASSSSMSIDSSLLDCTMPR